MLMSGFAFYNNIETMINGRILYHESEVRVKKYFIWQVCVCAVHTTCHAKMTA